jgi:uracil-DNA glycosylase
MMTWTEALAKEKTTPYFQELMLYVQSEREAGKVIYPPKEDVFNAFAMTALEDIRVVILGQDPYHGPNQAHGLCFSVLPGVKIPPSLRNIYKELADDIDGFTIPNHGTLSPWAEQGVLLLNTVLTVEQGKAHSHAKLGWETFTDRVIEVVNQHCSNVVFLLWGSHAQKKGNTINREKHHVLHAPHPSPLSAHRGFFGSKPFSQTNQLLVESGKMPIVWQV